MTAHELTQLESHLMRQVTRACSDFGLLEAGDRVLVAMSGGKDSYALLDLLLALQRRAPFKFDVVAANIDQGQPGFDVRPLEQHLQRLQVTYTLVRDDTWAAVLAKIPTGNTPCWMCGRLRRAVLYNVASGLGCTKLALGHHRDDLVESLLMSALYSGVLKSMPVKLRADDGRNLVIRPLAYCAEADIRRYSEAKTHPIIPCGSCALDPDLKRKQTKQLLDQLEAANPNVRRNLLHALQTVVPAHLLDRKLFDFSTLTADSAPHSADPEAAGQSQ